MTTMARAGLPYPLRFKADNGYTRAGHRHQEQPVHPPGRLHDADDRHAGPGRDHAASGAGQAAVTQGGTSLSVAADGTYTYPWQTTTAWGNTCREFVFTTKTGVQHRAYFKFLAATHVDARAGGTVPATLGLTLGTPASFAPFIPGVARDYTATTHGERDQHRG